MYRCRSGKRGPVHGSPIGKERWKNIDLIGVVTIVVSWVPDFPPILPIQQQYDSSGVGTGDGDVIS